MGTALKGQPLTPSELGLSLIHMSLYLNGVQVYSSQICPASSVLEGRGREFAEGLFVFLAKLLKRVALPTSSNRCCSPSILCICDV